MSSLSHGVYSRDPPFFEPNMAFTKINALSMRRLARFTWLSLAIALSTPAISFSLDLIISSYGSEPHAHQLLPRPLGLADYGLAAFGPLAVAAWTFFFVFGYKWAMERPAANLWGWLFIVSGSAACLALGHLFFFCFFSSAAAWALVLWAMATGGPSNPPAAP